LIAAHGAVSGEVARAMAAGAIAQTPATFAVAVTGIAGPDGGTPAKPVGTVWIATCARGGEADAVLLQASGDRAAVRAQSVVRALERLLKRVEASPREGT
jgi:nicotinamide-nucleotide amidase